MSRSALSRGLIAAFAALALGISAGAAVADPVDAVARINVYVVDPNLPKNPFVTQGSGVLVSTGGLILTAKHVVQAGLPDGYEPSALREFKVDFGNLDRQATAKPLGCAPGDVDICVLQISAKAVRDYHAVPMPLSCALLEDDNVVVAYGYPPGDFQEMIDRDGRIDGGPIDAAGRTGTNLRITPGMSGGPVLRDGLVIALNAGALEIGGTTFENLTFVQPLYRAGSTIRDSGVKCSEEPGELPPPPDAREEPVLGLDGDEAISGLPEPTPDVYTSEGIHRDTLATLGTLVTTSFGSLGKDAQGESKFGFIPMFYGGIILGPNGPFLAGSNGGLDSEVDFGGGSHFEARLISCHSDLLLEEVCVYDLVTGAPPVPSTMPFRCYVGEGPAELAWRAADGEVLTEGVSLVRDFDLTKTTGPVTAPPGAAVLQRGAWVGLTQPMHEASQIVGFMDLTALLNQYGYRC